MKTLVGKSNEFDDTVLGIITKERKFFRKNYIFLEQNLQNTCLWGYRGVVSSQPRLSRRPNIIVSGSDELSKLNEGDIVTLSPNGEISVVWDIKAIDNSLLMTEQCNCNCIMCPQPPKKDEDDLFEFNKDIFALLDPEQVKSICLTGGEPTFSKEKFIEILKVIKKKFSNATVNILTNGKSFADFDFAKAIAQLNLKNLVFCISIHGDTSDIHNKIVRVPKSFEKTVLGIENLALFRQNIELRFVVNKLNYDRLIAFSEFVYKNFPFVVHVAFMGQEISGFARKNFSEIWIDPLDYQEKLAEAVIELHRRAINVSIYNIPLCLLSSKAWRFARQSISGWKNIYLVQCESCMEKVNCCGAFSTSDVQSKNITPFCQKS